MDYINESYKKVIIDCIGYSEIDGGFIKKHYDELYKKSLLKKVEDEEYYTVYYYSVKESVYNKVNTFTNKAMVTEFFCIPDINDELVYYTFNNSSVYALEKCNYEFNDINDDETE
jgi:hypothetical protein